MKSLANQEKSTLFYVVQIVHALLMVLIFLAPTISFTHNRKIQAAISIVVFLLSFYLMWKDIQIIDLLLCLYCGILIIWTLVILGTDWLYNRHIYHTIASLSFALLLKNRKIHRITIILPFILLVGFVVLSVLFFKESISDGKFFHLNRNSFGKILLVYATLIAIFDYYNGAIRPYIWPALFILVIGGLSNSRGGLGISIIYFTFIVFFNLKYLLEKQNFAKKYEINRKLGSLILFTVVLLVLIIVILLIKNSTFMDKGLSSNGRVEIIKSYLSDLNYRTFFTGFRPTIYDKYNHMHNSYLTIHALNGIGAFPAFYAIIIIIIGSFKKSFFLFGIIGIYCFYSLFEHVFFFNIADYIVFSLFFILREQTQKKNGFLDLKPFDLNFRTVIPRS